MQLSDLPLILLVFKFVNIISAAEKKIGRELMAGSVNKVVILGNLGVDPEVRSFPNGGKVCNLRICYIGKLERQKHW